VAEGDWKLPWKGGCRCRATRIRVTAPLMLSGAASRLSAANSTLNRAKLASPRLRSASLRAL